MAVMENCFITYCKSFLSAGIKSKTLDKIQEEA